MRALQLRIPPLALLLLTAFLMAVIVSLVPAMTFPIPYPTIIGCGFASVGAAMSLVGVLSFRRVGTTVNPLKPDTSSSLVRSGVYNLTRNPMYVGFLMGLIGWAVYL